ncbi:MAG: GNAT family N-acetyltransferase [Parachlamydiales bacterium]|jgi:predicted N-acyltransferase
MDSSKGWLTAIPLEKYSSLHKLSLMGLLGWKYSWPQKYFYVQFVFNLHTPLIIDPKAYLVFHTIDEEKASSFDECCYTISRFKRWRIDISSYSSFDDYIASLIRWHRNVYAKAKRKFTEYGVQPVYIEEDWTTEVQHVYDLYCNVAVKHGNRLYDLTFFEEISNRTDYKLLCCRYDGKIIAMCILQVEEPTLHSICCGFDYNHSSKCYAYSWLNYEIIRMAIESHKYQEIDIGLTADEAKQAIGFNSVSSRMDIYCKGPITRRILKVISHLLKAKISSEGKLNLSLRS